MQDRGQLLTDDFFRAALKDADGLIRDMLTECDINHDGQITYDGQTTSPPFNLPSIAHYTSEIQY